MKRIVIMIVVICTGALLNSCTNHMDEPEEIVQSSRIYLNPDDSLAIVKIYEGLKLKESGQEWDLTDPFSWPGIHFEIMSDVAYVKSVRINSLPTVNPVTADKLAILPEEIGMLSHLRHLSIREAYLWNDLPDSFFDLPIEELSFWNVQRIIPLDDRISRLAPTLKYLSVVGSEIKNLSEGVEDLINLEMLNLPGNRMEGKVPDFLFRFKCAVYLYSNNFNTLDWDNLYESVKAGYSMPMLYNNRLDGIIPQKFDTEYWDDMLMKSLFPQQSLSLKYESGEVWPKSYCE